MEIALQLLIGIGLAATCGFRVFTPLLAMGIAAMAGYLNLDEGFQWIASFPAIIVFGTATLVEITAYFFPYVDNLLSAVSVPFSVAAGTLATAAVVTDLNPSAQWLLALIAGGGVAASTSLFSNAIRHTSTLLTGGLANPLIASVESLATLILSALAIVLPVVAVIVIILILVFVYRAFRGIKHRLKRSDGNVSV